MSVRGTGWCRRRVEIRPQFLRVQPFQPDFAQQARRTVDRNKVLADPTNRGGPVAARVRHEALCTAVDGIVSFRRSTTNLIGNRGSR